MKPSERLFSRREGLLSPGDTVYIVSWKSLYRSRKDGGLGVKDLENMNAASLAKWLSRFLSDMIYLWGPVIEGLYYTRRRPLIEGASFRLHSQRWISRVVGHL